MLNNYHLVMPFFKKLTQRLVKKYQSPRKSQLEMNFETQAIEEIVEDELEEDEIEIRKINNTPKNRFNPGLISFKNSNGKHMSEKKTNEGMVKKSNR
jgi:hypothetical protein